MATSGVIRITAIRPQPARFERRYSRRVRRVLTPVLTPVIAGLLLVACGGAQPGVPQAGARPTTATVSEALPVGALDFSLPNVNGGQIEGASLQGRDLALWFWAPW